jgi:ATP-dependent RNA helicase SUPV3L1/SUV3
LWAQKQDNVDLSALSGAQHLAGSGRTSFPVDKQLARDAYRVLGYKQCGERAVRVDILERLADLIRPALSWRESSPGEKPAGAFDGRGFVVTQAMTSLTGSAGEDFASVLRALGYRMDRRPPLPPKPVVVEAVPAEAASAEAPAVEAASEAISSPEAITQDNTPPEAVAAEPAVAAETGDIADVTSAPAEETPAPSAALLPDVTITSEATPAEAPQETVAASEAASAEAAQEAVDAEATAETAAPPETPAAPELVEVWRPGGRSEERRPRHDRNRHQRHGHQAPAADGAAPAAAGEAGTNEKREHHRRGRRHRHNEFRKPGEGAPAEAAAAAAPAEGAPAAEAREGQPQEQRHHRGNRPPRERFEGKDRERDKGGRPDKFGGDRNKGDRNKDRDRGPRDKGGRDGGRDKRDSGPSHRQWATSAAPRERDRPVDPNSPFAKLAALKEQLTAGRKD